MAVDQFIKIGAIKDESQDHKHKDSIDVLAWSWGESQSGTFHQGGGGGAGKVNVQDLSFTAYIGKAVPDLLMHCSNGKHIPEATLTVRKAGEDPLEYIIIKMEKCMVTSVSMGGSGGEDRLTYNCTLNFAKVSVKYTEQKPEGGKGVEPEYKWDIAANKAV